MASLIVKAITWYNNKPHKALYGFSPNQMKGYEEALFHANNKRKQDVKEQQSSYPFLVLYEDNVPALTKTEQSIYSWTVNQL